MATTARVQYPYPDKNQDPWFDGFAALMVALDYTTFADREDKNSVLMGGGTMTFTSSTGVLTWSSQIQLLSPITGYSENIAPGSVTIANGQCFYVVVTRGPSNNVSLVAPVVSPFLPNGDDNLLIGYRLGATVYFRNGRTINNGNSGTVLEDTVGANAQYVPSSLPNWNGTAPTDIANALDRIAAKIGPIT